MTVTQAPFTGFGRALDNFWDVEKERGIVTQGVGYDGVEHGTGGFLRHE